MLSAQSLGRLLGCVLSHDVGEEGQGRGLVMRRRASMYEYSYLSWALY